MNIEELIYIIKDQNELVYELIKNTVERELVNNLKILKGKILLISV